VNESKVKDWIVKILPSETAEETKGTGFWSAPEGCVLTCWHVVEQMEQPWVVYKGKRNFAEIVDHVGDIALLRVNELHGPPAPLDLQSHWKVGNKIYSLGYQYEGRQGDVDLGYFEIGEGKITGDAELDRYGAIVLEGARYVEQGASGAPALNLATGKVIGLIGAKWPHQECQFVLPLSLLDADTEPWRLLRPRFQEVDYRYKQEDIFRFYEESFVGRNAEIDKVRRLISSGQGGYLVFQGKAGMGKSALVAELARQAATGKLHPQLSFLVYFIRQEGKRHTPEAFLGSLNRQLLQLLARNEEVPLTLLEMERQYEKLWEEVKGKVADHNPLLVLSDGWDEAAWGGEQPLSRYLPSVIPPYLSWVLTSRPLPEMRRSLPSTHPLESLEPEELPGLGSEEVRQLLQQTGDQVPRSEVFIVRLVAATRGEPLFLRFLCQDIARWGEKAERHLEEIPQGVEQYFIRQLEQLRERARHHPQRAISFDILKTLLVAYSGMTAQELAGIMKVDLEEIREGLIAIERYLLGQERFELMHLEFRHTLEQKFFRQAEKEAALERLVAYCAGNWARKIPSEEYPIGFYLRHLYDLERFPEMLKACQAGFLTAKLERLVSPEWLEEDYTLLHRACEKLDDLAALLTWGEERAQIADEVVALRDIKGLPKAIGRLGQGGDKACLEKGMGLCALMPSREEKITAYLSLCQGLKAEPGNAPEVIFERAKTLLEKMSPGGPKDRLLGKYVQTLSRWGEPHLSQALLAAGQIDSESERAQALVAVAQGYAQLADQEQATRGLSQILKAAGQMEEWCDRVYLLEALAHSYAQLADQEKATWGLSQILKAAGEIYEDRRVKVLVALAQGYAQLKDQELAALGVQKIMEPVGQIGDWWNRAQVLAAVAQGYAQLGDQEQAARGLQQAMEAAGQIKSEGSRAEVLAAVAQGYTQLEDQTRAAWGLRQILAAADQIKREDAQSEVLALVAKGYELVGNKEQANRILMRALKVGGKIHSVNDLHRFLATLTQVYARLKDREQVIPLLRQTLEVVGQRSDMLAAVAQGYAQLEDPKQAASALCQILEAAEQIEDENEKYRAGALVAVAQGYARLGDQELATQGLCQIMEAAGQIEDEEYRAHVLAAVAQGYAQLGDQEQAARVVSQAIEAVGQKKSEELPVKVLVALAQGYAQLGDHEEATRVLGQALKAAGLIKSSWKRDMVLASMAQGYSQLKDQEQAARGLQQIMEAAGQIDCWERADVLVALAQGYAQLRDQELAARGLQKIMEEVGIFLKYGEFEKILVRAAVAQGYAQLEDQEQAAQILWPTLEALEQIMSYNKNNLSRSYVLVALAQACAQLKDQELAAQGLQKIMEEVGGIFKTYAQFEKTRVRAAVAQGYAQLEDPKQAASAFCQILEFYRFTKEALVLVALAQGYAKLGDQEQAALVLRQGLEAVEELSSDYDRAEVLVALSQGYAQLKDQEQAFPVLRQTLEAAEQILDEWYRSKVLAALAEGYEKSQNTETDNILASIPNDEEFIQGCQAVVAAYSLREREPEKASVSRLPYRFFPLASKRRRNTYYQVIAEAIPYLLPEHLDPVLRFLEERFFP
jgi:hypothetical protein